MFKSVDKFLDGISMYRLVLYFLLILSLIAVIFSVLGFLPYSPLSLLISLLLIFFFCFLFNKIFAFIFNVTANSESYLISGLIISFLILPPKDFNSWSSFAVLIALSTLIAMASKYLLAPRRALIFNPAAFGVALSTIILNQSASWWIGNTLMWPFVLLGGLLIVRKTNAGDLVKTFFLVFLAIDLFLQIKNGFNLSSFIKVFTGGPTLFLAFVMLTEPQTAPVDFKYYKWYAASVAALLVWPNLQIFSFYFNPERALLTGNLFSAIISKRQRRSLKLLEKKQESSNVYTFSFSRPPRFAWAAGQYLEWTLPTRNTDSRGNRRYFTVASSPTEDNIKIGVKFYPRSSRFKDTLLNLQPNQEIIISQPMGDFILPADKKQKLVLIAGGIGITPFRSMLQYLIDKKEKRDVVLLYAAKVEEDFVYKTLIDDSKVRTVYNLDGRDGFLTQEKIKNYIPDFKERIFYLSGPHVMVATIEETVASLGLPKAQIITDYFPGYS